MFLGPAILINDFTIFGYISVSTIDLLGPGQIIELVESRFSVSIYNCTIWP